MFHQRLWLTVYHNEVEDESLNRPLLPHGSMSLSESFLAVLLIHVRQESPAVPFQDRLIAQFPVPVLQMGVVNPGKIECSLLKQIRSLPDHLKSDPFFSVFRDRSDTARAADSHPLMPSPVTQNAEGSDPVPVKSAEYRRILRKILNPVLINLSDSRQKEPSADPCADPSPAP